MLDDDGAIDLNRLFDQEISSHGNRRTFTVNGCSLEATHLCLYASSQSGHRIHYCAHNREVMSESLSQYLPDLVGALHDADGRHFQAATYVSGYLLDESVNSERTDFVLSDLPLGLFPSEVSKKDLREAAVAEVRDFLQPFLETIRSEKLDRIESYVHQEAPQYRPLLKHSRDHLEEIPASATGDDLTPEF